MSMSKPLPEPIPLPVKPVLRIRVRSFYIRPAPPDDPTAPSWTWACEDCGENGTSGDPADLGWQLAGHMQVCAG